MWNLRVKNEGKAPQMYFSGPVSHEEATRVMRLLEFVWDEIEVVNTQLVLAS